jgi:hypothetical protein
MSNTRRAQAKVSLEATGVVYLLHFHQRLGTGRHYAQHSAYDLVSRLAEHAAGRGARLLAAAREQSVSWHLVRQWPGGRAEERALKDARNAPRCCPECAAAAGRQAQQRLPAVKPRPVERAPMSARDRAAAAPPRPALAPQERGVLSAERFLAQREGQSADQIAAALDYVTGPYGENGPRSEAAAREMATFIATVTPGIEAQRTTERAPAPADQPQEGTPEMSTDTAQERQVAEVETRPATEWMKGARTAHELIVRQVEAGHSADRIAERWDEALATYDDSTASPAEREWHAGAEETARDMIQTWRDMQRAEAEQAQATRDEHQADRDGGGWRLSERDLDARDPGHQEPEHSPEPEMEAAS